MNDAAHPDILDQTERWQGPLARSLGVHGAVAAVVAVWSLTSLGSRVEKWGDPQSLGGGAVGITPVKAIPLPSREGRINRVANDTESQVPAPPKPQQRKAELPDPKAIALKSKRAQERAAPAPASKQRYTPVPNPRPNQVYSSTGQALTSPIFSQAPGGGGVGSGTGSPLGARFGWYEQLLRERVARNWRSQDLDARVQQRVAVTFDIQRDGSIRNVRVTQSSGNFPMDQSAQRAIIQSSPLPALPREFERDVATIEFWFSLQQ